MTIQSTPSPKSFPSASFLRRLAACLLLSAAAAGAATADVVRRHTLPASGVSELAIVAGVGDIDLKPGPGDQIEVEVEIRSKASIWGARNKDLSGVDIGIKRSGGRLELSLEDEKLQADWTIRVPRSAAFGLSVALGVGDIDIAPPGGAMEIALGVGDVEVKARKAQVGGVNVAVGVGDASISGGDAMRIRSFVGATGSARGAGASAFDVSIGVGDADIRLD